MKLPRQPGQKDARYAHLLSGQPEISHTEVTADERPSRRTTDSDRIHDLEQKVDALNSEVDRLRQQFEEFRKQFE
jgi:uncharacterized protein YceH (UPF0502 family)